MNKDIKWIIIETLDITPSEFEKRFEPTEQYKELSDYDYNLLKIAEKCYECNREQIEYKDTRKSVQLPWRINTPYEATLSDTVYC